MNTVNPDLSSQSARGQVSCHEHSYNTNAKPVHDALAIILRHFAMQTRNFHFVLAGLGPETFSVLMPVALAL